MSFATDSGVKRTSGFRRPAVAIEQCANGLFSAARRAADSDIGAGIACIGMGGAGVGVGIIFGNYLAAALRNPSAAQGQFGNLIFGFAITEALGIFSLLIALLLLFAL